MNNILELNDLKQNQSWNNVENSGIIDMISKYNLAKVLTALYKIGFINAIRNKETISHESLQGYDDYLIGHLLKYLMIHGILVLDVNGYYLTNHGKSLLSEESIAQLCFYTEAYENITSNIDKFLLKKAIYGKDILRDGKSLGIHCDTLFKEYHTATILEAINDFDCKKILDIGCGGGQFLIDICKKNNSITGIGLDISEPAINYAIESSQNNNFKSRLSFVVADAFNLSTWPSECLTADILCGSGVVHEHFRNGEDAVINILNTYAQLLTDKGFKAIILGEPELRYDLVKSDSDLYLVHIFTAQGFPHHREEWTELFSKSALKCEKVYTRPSAGPRFNFFVLTLK